MRARHLVMALAAVLAGCGETTLEVSSDRAPPLPSVVGSGAACTHRWASAVDGSWDDPARWSTGTVPAAPSVVCIEAVGTYSVTVPYGYSGKDRWIAELRLGNGSSPITLKLLSANLYPTGQLSVARGADLRCLADPTINVGSRLFAETMTNDGTVHLAACDVTLFSAGVALRNGGDLVTEASFQWPRIVLYWGGIISMEAGRIGGSGYLDFGGLFSDFGTWRWTGGVLEGMVGHPSVPVARVNRLKLELVNSALVGLIAYQPTNIFALPQPSPRGEVEGVVGPAVHLTISDVGETHFATIGGGPILNEGTVTFVGPTVATGRIINTGTLDVNVPYGDLELRLDSLVNQGTLLIRDSTRFTDPSGILVNKGTVTAATGASLVIAGGDFIAESPGSMSGRLILENGRLGGTGYVSILPVDQGIEHSAGASFAPNPIYFDPENIVKLAVEGGCNAVASTLGVLGTCARKYAHRIPFIVKVNHNEFLTYPNKFDQIMFGQVKQARDMGAVAVGATIYFGSDNSSRQIVEVSQAFHAAHEMGLATILWCYLRNPAFKKDKDYHLAADLTGQANHLGVTIEADIIKQKLPETPAGGFKDLKFGKYDERMYSELMSPHPIDMTRYQVAHCYMGRIPLINSGGASGANDLQDAVKTAVINKRAGGSGLISGRKAFQKPMAEGVALLNAVQDVYLCDEITLA